MWSAFSAVFLGLLLKEAFGLRHNSSGCSEEPDCLKCGPNGCIKCSSLIIYPTRKCVNACPFGYRQRWSTNVDYMGRMCVHSGNILGLSTETLVILTGIITGTILCVIIIVSAIVYLKYKKNISSTIETGSDLDDSPERKDFVKQLETLRPYAENFLDMLNDTRKQVRELHQNGDVAAYPAYKPVLRDLAKILLLLNRPVERVVVPEDWEHLFNWCEKTLKRCKRMSQVSQPQVAQLINFLQSPIPASEGEYSIRGSTTMSTFKPDQPFGSSLSLQDVAIKNFNSNYDSTFHTPLNPQWKFDYALVSNSMPTSEFNPAVWKNSKEYLNNPYFLDDDFCQLGFRPQDEITTEL